MAPSKGLDRRTFLTVAAVVTAMMLMAAPAVAARPTDVEVASIVAGSGDPLRVSYELDGSRAASTIIGAEGGALSTVAADGTTYTLEVPPGALGSPTQVRMTPVDGLDGVPFGDEHHVVYLEPDGLRFDATATLTIDPPVDIPVEEQLFIGFEGDDADLVLRTPDPARQDMAILVDHFSAAGITKGLLADTTPYRTRLGGTAEARISSAMAAETTRARQEIFRGGGESEPQFAFEPFVEAYTREVAQPRIAAAAESCAAGNLAIQSAMEVVRRQVLAAMEETPILISEELMDVIAENCLREEYELCRDEHVIHRIRDAAALIEKRYQLLGIHPDDTPSRTADLGQDYVRRCLSFRLEFHSELDFDGGKGGRYTSEVDSKVKLNVSAEPPWPVEGTAQLVNRAFRFKAKGCKTTPHRGGTTFTVRKLEPVVTFTEPTTDGPPDPGRVTDMVLTYRPGQTTERVTVKCPGQPSFDSPQTAFWTGPYMAVHEKELTKAGDFEAKAWEVLGDELYARKEWVRDAGKTAEVGTLKLYHTPQ